MHGWQMCHFELTQLVLLKSVFFFWCMSSCFFSFNTSMSHYCLQNFCVRHLCSIIIQLSLHYLHFFLLGTPFQKCCYWPLIVDLSEYPLLYCPCFMQHFVKIHKYLLIHIHNLSFSAPNEMYQNPDIKKTIWLFLNLPDFTP